MSEGRHPGPHPDADRLSAFIEGALTEQERQESLAHLAECAECRSIVFLAQEVVPAPMLQPSTLSVWRRWLPPLSLAAAAAACCLVITLWIRPHPTTRSVAKNVAVARQTAPPLPPVSTQAAGAAPQGSVTPARSRQAFAAKKPVPAVSRRQAAVAAPTGAIRAFAGGSQSQAAPSAAKQAPAAASNGQPPTALVVGGAVAQLPTAPATGSAFAAQRASGNVASMRANSTLKQSTAAPPPAGAGALTAGPAVNRLLAPGNALHLTIEHNEGPDNGFSAIRGAVTDLSGAAIPHASVTLQNAAGGTIATATTDANGQFAWTTIAPGQYELQISATGFTTGSERLDLQARDLALLKPTLKVGAATQTVEVVEDNKTLATTSAATGAQLAAIVPALPGKLPAAATVANNGRMLALDTAGTLYLSRDAGHRWKKVRPVWTGSIAHLAVTPEAESSAHKEGAISGVSSSSFELTATDGAVWISSDGAHWRLR